MASTYVFPSDPLRLVGGSVPARQGDRVAHRLCRRLELSSLALSRESRIDGQCRKAAPLVELRFRWPHADGTVASLQSIEIHELPREVLHRLRIDCGPCTVEDLTSLSDGRGRWIPAGELMWAMAATSDSRWHGRLTLSVTRPDVLLEDLQVTLWVSQVSARPLVDVALLCEGQQRRTG